MTRQERSEAPTNLDSSALGGSFGSTHRMRSEISVRFRGSDGGAIECGLERSSQNAMFMEAVARPAPRCCQLPHPGLSPSDVLVSPGSWPLSFEGDLIAAASDPGQDLTVLHDLRLLVVFRGRSLRASRVYCAYFPLRATE